MKKWFPKSIAAIILCAMALGLGGCVPTRKQPEQTDAVTATVVEIEKFGHAVLDMTTADFIRAGFDLGDIVSVEFGSYEANMPFFDGYYTNPSAVMLRGAAPEDQIALCINYGDFSGEMGLAIGDVVAISMAEKAGMLAYQELCALSYSNLRTDYSADAVFANFRMVTAGGIGSGKLYRTASPIDNAHGRAGYADDLIADAGVATVLNLADSEADIARHCEAEGFASDYYRSLYEAGNVMALDLGSNFFADSFGETMVEGLRFLSRQEPPYCLHCTEGKDRAGFAVMLISALMGAELEEIIDDYMLSFSNYYGIDKETQPERYEAVLSNNLMAILFHVTGADSVEMLQQMDLETAVTDYLLDHGMTAGEILTLQEKLR